MGTSVWLARKFTVSRTAIFMASFKSSSNPIRIQWVCVSARDQNPRERLEVKHDPWLEFGLTLDQVKLVETNKPVRELGREQADGRKLRPGQVEVEAVSFGHNLLDANLHGVARLGLADVNR